MIEMTDFHSMNDTDDNATNEVKDFRKANEAVLIAEYENYKDLLGMVRRQFANSKVFVPSGVDLEDLLDEAFEYFIGYMNNHKEVEFDGAKLRGGIALKVKNLVKNIVRERQNYNRLTKELKAELGSEEDASLEAGSAPFHSCPHRQYALKQFLGSLSEEHRRFCVGTLYDMTQPEVLSYVHHDDPKFEAPLLASKACARLAKEIRRAVPVRDYI
jgi:hypothetical protein